MTAGKRVLKEQERATGNGQQVEMRHASGKVEEKTCDRATRKCHKGNGNREYVWLTCVLDKGVGEGLCKETVDN